MAKHLDLGKKGEKLATSFLEQQGYRILERNWRFSRAEVDIIAMNGPILVFIEVKSRSSRLWGAPEMAISTKKERLLIDAAMVYMEQIEHEWEIRFDVISIVFSSPTPSIRHFKDAFFPSW